LGKKDFFDELLRPSITIFKFFSALGTPFLAHIFSPIFFYGLAGGGGGLTQEKSRRGRSKKDLQLEDI
jgi:hypothetical protein